MVEAKKSYQLGLNESINNSRFGLKSFPKMTDSTNKLHTLNFFGFEPKDIFSESELKKPLTDYDNFLGPFSSPQKKDFSIPFCYFSRLQSLKTSTLAKIHLTTLFYIFYEMPRDALQCFAAMELYNREWRYHKPSQRWFSQKKKNGEWTTFDILKWDVIPYNSDITVLQKHFANQSELSVMPEN